MEIWQATLLGIVQGITEYLPISSSAHLLLLPQLFGQPNQGLWFDVFLHSGTLLATVFYFRKDWILLFKGRAEVSLQAIAIATVPALLAGLLLHKWIENVARNPSVTIWTLSIGGILLFAADRWSRMDTKLPEMGLSKTFMVGVAQVLALVPGVSRSGITMTAARVFGVSRSDAARLSFLLSAPVTAAALGYESLKVIKILFIHPASTALQSSELVVDGGHISGWVYIAGFLASLMSGYFSIHFLMRYLRKASFLVFAVYRIGFAFCVYFVLKS